MNLYFLIAGILCIILGLIHSFLGEILIFKSKRQKGNIVPSKTSSDFKVRYLRIIWATWHLATVFGWCIGTIIVKISLVQNDLNSSFSKMIIQPIIFAMFIGFLLVLVGTKGKHPGWIVLLLIGILLIAGN